MTVTLRRMDPTGADREALIEFMTGNPFPFHLWPAPPREQVEQAIAEGAYRDDDNDSFWIDHAEHGRVGCFRFEDIQDSTAMFDLRLAAAWRGRGLATDILRAATDHVFTTHANVNRFEGQTREDNLAMRHSFVRAGWVQEAYYREGWPVEGEDPKASVAYSVLRRDWANGTTTPLRWALPGALRANTPTGE
ncbi:GNAT family N-acetyltransferase [Galactobacter caseinivorans]|uniref:N-acetyltransferase n=1 Tax=Galactobacter caseinivorans TaxID=2676123 RepID=A0A496PJE3_9MICC|nr:GNAT family protein [Galactobacter caseinivorans]RKW70623.1 N-acetyltransferase [Galactobacter caseinivorans]